MFVIRKNRSVSCSSKPFQSNNNIDEMVLATYTVIRAALNSVEVNGECSERFMCEGGLELRHRGEMGSMLVEMGGELLGESRQQGLVEGLQGDDCRSKYWRCRKIPDHYRHPGVGKGGQYSKPDAILEMIKDSVNKKIKK